MPNKRLEKEEEQQARAARSEEDWDAVRERNALDHGVNAAGRMDDSTEEMVEGDEILNSDEEDFEALEEEEEEAAQDAETASL
jgi:hypothetical protein